MACVRNGFCLYPFAAVSRIGCPATVLLLAADRVAERGISIWSSQLLRICCTASALAAVMTTRNAPEATGRGAAQPDMTSAGTGRGLRWTTGGLFVAGPVAFAAATMVLSSTFNWPDILREPASVVLPAFAGGGTSLVWTWFATGWTYAILAVPILLLPAVLGRRDDLALRVATYLGATSVVLSLIGFLRWVFVVPLATAVPGFPVWDLAGPIGSTGWGIWVAALGVTVLLRPAPATLRRPAPATRPATAEPGS
jgi:Domain of unknown function (DUF4386)